MAGEPDPPLRAIGPMAGNPNIAGTRGDSDLFALGPKGGLIGDRLSVTR